MSGPVVEPADPASLAYTIYCAVIWGICLGTCEMASFLPIRGGFITWAGMYLDDAASTASE